MVWRSTWTQRHRAWLAGHQFERVESELAFGDYLASVDAAAARKAALAERLSRLAQQEDLWPTVSRLRAFRGIDTLLHGWPRSPFPRPDRKDEPARFGKLGAVRQRIESVFATCKDQLGLERHGARTLPGLGARIGLRLLALTAALWHNHHIGDPGRHLAAYSH